MKIRKSIAWMLVFGMTIGIFSGQTLYTPKADAAGDGDNVTAGWSTYSNYNMPDLTSIVDKSTEKDVKFTHNEWKGTNYTDVDGNQVKGAEVYRINTKDDSVTSTSSVSYDNVGTAFTGAKDYNKAASAYVQYLTGKDDAVTDWSLVVVQNQDEAQKSNYKDFYKTDYSLNGDWKENLTLPASWEHYGFDFSIYANVIMPWQSKYDNNVTSPRSAVKYNPVGLYRKNFKVNEGLADLNGRINISFQGVESCYYVYVNGKEVGYSEDSYSPHSFDITDYLIKNSDGSIDASADNLLAVEVHKFCDGTWMEGQDFFYDGGIFRDVYLYATPLIHIEDYFVQTDLDDNYENAFLNMNDVTISNYSTQNISDGEYAIDVQLYNEDGSAFMNGYSIDIPALPAGSDGKCSVTEVEDSYHYISSPKLWSCEEPNLYVMVLTLYNKKTGAYIESLSQNLGFREVEFTRSEVNSNGRRSTNSNSYQQMLLNGKPFYLKGTNRHDTDPVYGKYVPHEVQFEDIKIMKQYNINAVRTSHYSNDEYLYYLCDKYGLYMMCETNVECHALMNSPESQKTPFKKLIMDRTVTAFERLKNRTANIMWSTGNENHYNTSKTYCDGMFYDLIWYFKDHDSTRPVHCESSHSENGVDVDSDMYPYDIKGVINKGNVTMPYLMCEYDHAMGNAVGSIKEYWEAVRGAKNNNILGGFIWDWVDQARFKSLDDINSDKLVTGEKYDYYAEDYAHQNLYADENDGMFFAYGGDNGENPNDNSFCVNGLVSPDRDVQPELNEVKYTYQNFWFNETTEDDIKDEWIQIYNESSFDNINKYDLVFEVYEDGTLLGTETVNNVSVEARSYGDANIPYKKYMPAQLKDGSNYYLNVYVKTKQEFKKYVDGEEKTILPAGHIIAYEQFDIPETFNEVTRTISTNNVDVTENDGSYDIQGELFSFSVDKTTGEIINYTYKDELLLEKGPMPNFWRAPINNDRNQVNDWQKVGAAAYVDSIETSVNDKGQNVISVALMHKGFDGIYTDITYTIDGSGAVTVDVSIDPRNTTISGNNNKRLLRVGTNLVLPSGAENVYWYGKGGYETMIDRCYGAKLGAYSSTVDKMFYPYLDTQDTGNLTGVKWFTVTDSNKKTALAITGKDEFEASALHFTADELTAARHPYDLMRHDETYVSISKVSAGAGNASCGPDTLDEYRLLADKVYDYSYTLVPYTATNAWGDMTGYVSSVTRQYRAEVSDYVYAKTSDPELPDPRPTPAPPSVTDNPPVQKDVPVVSPAPVPKDTVKAAPSKVKGLKASKKGGKVVLKWKKNKKADGYIIKRSLKKNKGFKKVAVIKKKKTVKYIDKKAKKNKTYYYKICAFVKDGSKKISGKYSKAVKIKA